MRDLKDKTINIGSRFSNWTVLERVEAPEHVKMKGHSFWKCECECGNQHILAGGNLRNSKTKGCKKCSMIGKRKAKGDCSFNGLYLRYKHGAESRNLEFILSNLEFRELTSQDCHYCGLEPSAVHKARTAYGEYKYSGVDRIDSNKGYTLSNCVPACKDCNRAKGSMPYAEFKAWINRLIIFNKEAQ